MRSVFFNDTATTEIYTLSLHDALPIYPNLLGRWKRQFEIGDGDYSNPGDKVAMQSELKRLRKENKRLQMEREILRKAAAFFANESS